MHAAGFLVTTFALFMSALLGIYQEIMFAKYGKHATEALFYGVGVRNR